MSGEQRGHNQRDSAEVRAIKEGFKDVTKWLAIQNETLFKGLAAIALAAANPDNNTEEIQAKIDAITADLKPEADALEDAVPPVL